ncbi:MAG TPA: glycosyltransferase family 4 protein [Acidimicrobiales bacterium]|nr:glycosyltransferase family 4 protein [Acidimicrobiales bacterium]
MTKARGALHLVTADQRRGAEVFAADLVAALEDDASMTHRLAALTAGPSDDGVGATPLGAKPFALSTLRALRGAARDAGAVVAHGSKTLPAGVAALAGLSTPLVYRSIGDPQAWSGQGLRRRRTALLLGRAARVVALWPAAADVLTTTHGIPADRIAVIPNAVPAARCPVPDPAARAAARRRFDLPVEAPVVVYIGALSAEKQVDAAIAAVGALDGVHLLVVGGGPLRAELEGRATAVAPGRVTFAGVLPGPQEALAAADALLLTSRTEGMPGVVIEAGLSAVPAVASRVGGVPEIVVPGETGALAEPSDLVGFTDGLRSVLAAAPEMGAAARRRCLARFEIGVVADQWRDLLDQVSRRPGPKAG